MFVTVGVGGIVGVDVARITSRGAPVAVGPETVLEGNVVTIGTVDATDGLTAFHATTPETRTMIKASQGQGFDGLTTGRAQSVITG